MGNGGQAAHYNYDYYNATREEPDENAAVNSEEAEVGGGSLGVCRLVPVGEGAECVLPVVRRVCRQQRPLLAVQISRGKVRASFGDGQDPPPPATRRASQTGGARCTSVTR